MLWAAGVGAEVIAPMAVPVLGGLLISDEVVDLFLPVRFFWVRRARWLRLQAEGKLSHQRAAETEHARATPAADQGGGVSDAGNAGGIVPPADPGGVRE